MTPKELAAWGQVLTGSTEYKAPLARLLGFNRRTIHRWANGQWPIPDDLEPRLRRLAKGVVLSGARERVAALKAIAGE